MLIRLKLKKKKTRSIFSFFDLMSMCKERRNMIFIQHYQENDAAFGIQSILILHSFGVLLGHFLDLSIAPCPNPTVG